MKKKCGIMCALVILSALFLPACGGGGSGSDTATVNPMGALSVGLTDATTDEFQAVYITVKEVSVSQTIAGDSEGEFDGDWIVVAEPNATYNLLELVNGVIQELGIEDIEAGTYSQMRLLLGETPEVGEDVVNINDEAHPYANYVVYGDSDTFEYFELKIPSGYQSGIKIVGSFEVGADELTDLVLDFNVVKSIVQAGASGQWLLKPTVKALDQDGSAIISGTVFVGDETSPIEGAIISAQNDVDGSETKVVSAATVSDEFGGYTLLLDPGIYTVVAIKEGYHSASAEVTAVENTTAGQNFQMVPLEQETGTIYGEVNILNGLDDQFVTINILQTQSDGSIVEIASKSVANGGTYWFDLPPGLYSMVAVFTAGGEDMTLEAYEAFEVEDGKVEKFDILFENVDESENGTVSGTPEKVTICHKGKSITISSSALQAHLNHGDTEGTCGEGDEASEAGEGEETDEEETGSSKITICHKGKTIEVSESALDAHLAHGDAIGACGAE